MNVLAIIMALALFIAKFLMTAASTHMMATFWFGECSKRTAVVCTTVAFVGLILVAVIRGAA